jgi:hypothetical protein
MNLTAAAVTVLSRDADGEQFRPNGPESSGSTLRRSVTVAQDPMSCVALGVGRVLDDLELLKKVGMPA